MVGIGLGLGDWASPLCLAAFGTAAFVQRIKVEEVTLRQALGQPYEAYATKHARLLPGADWIDQYESRHRRTAEAGENLRGRLHRAGLASIASSALSIAVTASWIAAVFNRFVLRDLDRFAKLGRRSGPRPSSDFHSSCRQQQQPSGGDSTPRANRPGCP